MRKTHGLYKTAEYCVWENMIQRCTNPKHPSFKRYGGRGISVSDEWRSFESFLADMGSRPTDQHSIDRIENDLGYCKENCRWATSSQQLRNYSRNRYIDTPLGRMLMCEAAEKSGLKFSTIKTRLRYGWPAERLFDPIRNRSKK